ncbi:hypothetical protein HDV57DRAFT_350064 [Trichoderma longibrachiatum]
MGIVDVNLTHIIELGRRYFDLHTISQEHFLERAWPEVMSSIDCSPFTNSLSALQWKYLFRSAVAQCFQQPEECFDAITVSRELLPLPVNAIENLTKFLSKIRLWDTGHATIMSSALVMNAFPPRMNLFPPDEVFDVCYLPLLKECEAASGISSLIDDIRNGFSKISNQNRKSSKSATAAHREITRNQQGIQNLFICGICCFCLMRTSSRALKCGHELCALCFILLGEEIETAQYTVLSCPLCGNLDNVTVLFKPPTAGRLVLNLNGYFGDDMWHFLKDLQRGAGLNSMPLRDYFDVILAGEAGLQLAFSYFVKKIPLHECKRITQHEKPIIDKILQRNVWARWMGSHTVHPPSNVVIEKGGRGIRVCLRELDTTSDLAATCSRHYNII